MDERGVKLAERAHLAHDLLHLVILGDLIDVGSARRYRIARVAREEHSSPLTDTLTEVQIVCLDLVE